MAQESVCHRQALLVVTPKKRRVRGQPVLQHYGVKGSYDAASQLVLLAVTVHRNQSVRSGNRSDVN